MADSEVDEKQLDGGLRVKWFFVDISLRTYLKIQAGVFLFLGVITVLLWTLLRDHEDPFLARLWWAGPVLAVLELGELALVVFKARRDHARARDH